MTEVCFFFPQTVAALSRIETRAPFPSSGLHRQFGEGKGSTRAALMLLLGANGHPFPFKAEKRVFMWAPMDNGPSLLFWVLAIPPTHTRISVEVNMEIFTFRCNLHVFLCSSGQRTRQVGEILVCTLFTCSAQGFVGVWALCTMVSLNSWSRKNNLAIRKNNLLPIHLLHLVFH